MRKGNTHQFQIAQSFAIIRENNAIALLFGIYFQCVIKQSQKRSGNQIPTIIPFRKNMRLRPKPTVITIHLFREPAYLDNSRISFSDLFSEQMSLSQGIYHSHQLRSSPESHHQPKESPKPVGCSLQHNNKCDVHGNQITFQHMA